MFALSAIEKEQFDNWRKKHNRKCVDRQEGVQLLTYMFTPTGIGNIVEVRCSCGKVVDVTDSSNW